MTPTPPEADESPDGSADEKRSEPSKAAVPASDAATPDWDEDPNSSGSYASPPCFMHELDPSYLRLHPSRDAGPVDPADAQSAKAGVEGADDATKPGEPGAT